MDNSQDSRRVADDKVHSLVDNAHAPLLIPPVTVTYRRIEDADTDGLGGLTSVRAEALSHDGRAYTASMDFNDGMREGLARTTFRVVDSLMTNIVGDLLARAESR